VGEQLIVVQLLMKFSAFNGTRRFITVFTTAHPVPHSESLLCSPHPHIHFDIILPFTSRCYNWTLTLRLTNHNSVCVSYLHANYKSFPSHPLKGNKIGKVYSLEYTNIPKVFFTPHHVGRCCNNAIRGHCCSTMRYNNELGSHCCTTKTLVMQTVYLLGRTRQSDRQTRTSP
jgi:hypothetical protein